MRQCYELDSRTISLSNFYSTKVDNRLVVDGKDEVLNGRLPYLPIKNEYANKVEETLILYQKEKSFYAFAHFIIGYLNGNRVCAPLFLIPAEIVRKNGYAYAKLNLDEKFLNVNFLSQLFDEGSLSLDAVFNDVLAEPFLDFGSCGKLNSIFEKYFTDVNGESLLLYPDLFSERKVKSTRPKTDFRVVPSLSFGTVRFSTQTLGIRTELGELEKLEPSLALNALLNNQNKQRSFRGKSHCPSILSAAQEKAVQNASTYLKSVIVGPPGTGKSFTIANIALDLMQQGKSVLIVSKTDAAVDVVHEKLIDFGFGDTVFRGGRKEYLPQIKNRLQTILRSRKTKIREEYRYSKYERTVNQENKKLKSLSRKFKEIVDDEKKWGQKLSEIQFDKGFIANLRVKYIGWRQSLSDPLWYLTREYYQKQEEYKEILKLDIQDRYDIGLEGVLKYDRDHLAGFLKSIRATSLTEQTKRFGKVNMNIVLKAVPIWLCNLSDLYRVLPYESNLFDVVLIDEASQCDIATALPAIQRAKSMTIVGDPKQLRHFSFVSEGQMNRLAQSCEVPMEYAHLLDYKNSSILDLVYEQCTSSDMVTFLDEHFRGNNQLLSFSNEMFYDGDLKAMKSLPIHNFESVNFIETNGSRDSKGVNHREIEDIIDWIERIVASEVDLKIKSTIGVLSPFSKQVDAILRQLEEKFTIQTILDHQILVATAYGFQGNERDVMLVSWCVDNDTNVSALNYLNKEEVFNVAITRSSYRMVNFISFDRNQLKTNSLLRKYYEHMLDYEFPAFGSETEDDFISEVTKSIENQVEELSVNGNLASIPVDILVKVNGKYKVIDLVGYPGEFFDSIQLNQYMLLQRVGADVFPISYANWVFDKSNVLKELKDFLNA